MTETLANAIPADLDRRVEELLRDACRRELRFATAESCTGGLLASLLTDVDGSAHAYERGFVTYSNDAKHELLGVDEKLLEDPGPVSDVVARAMAEGALSNSKADIAISVTGFAGRGAPGDEAGLVYFGLAQRGLKTLHREEHFGDVGRGEVRLRALQTSLELLRQAIDTAAEDGAGR